MIEQKFKTVQHAPREILNSFSAAGRSFQVLQSDCLFRTIGQPSEAGEVEFVDQLGIVTVVPAENCEAAIGVTQTGVDFR